MLYPLSYRSKFNTPFLNFQCNIYSVSVPAKMLHELLERWPRWPLILRFAACGSSRCQVGVVWVCHQHFCGDSQEKSKQSS